ncbi:hypothetical protein BUQ74_18115 [Leptospira weilii serovar Heyan]|nr:hypothetical protein BUQ74_18115 [Leptospira weilii serovar Heyan]
MSEFRQIYLRIQVFVGKVMIGRCLLSLGKLPRMSSGSRCTLVSYSPNFYYAEFMLNYKMKTRTKQISQLNLRNRFYSFQKRDYPGVLKD